MGRPARVADPGRRGRGARLRSPLQLLEVADGADVVESFRLEQGEPGRVVPPVLEALEPLEQERLTGSLSDVSDDPAHVVPPSIGEKTWKTQQCEEPGFCAVPPSGRSAELLLHERGDASTERRGLFVRLCLGKDADHGLSSRRPHQYSPAAEQLPVHAVDLVTQAVT